MAPGFVASASGKVTALTSAVADRLAAWERIRTERPADFWHGCLFGAFWFSLAIFPIGYGVREIMPLVCLLFLLLYYRHAWRQSVLARLPVKWLFVCGALMVTIGIICSGSPWDSLLHAGTGVNKGFILPFIGMECVRSEKDLRRLTWACVAACFWEGLDGVWQAATGRDFIMGYAPNSGRLTGSLGDYTVGNYIALALIPAFGIFFVLRNALGRCATAFTFVALLWPAFFLLEGASSRSGILAVAGAFGLWSLLRLKGWHWRTFIWPLLFLALYSLLQPQRAGLTRIVTDNRWDLWHLGWRIFLEHPWFGAGAGQYNAAFRSLGLAPEREVITISHPHNLYLDMLYAHGLVGFCLGMIFLAGFLWWGWRHIRPRLLAECAIRQKTNEPHGDGAEARTRQPVYWRLAAWFWLGYAGWLINGIFGHDFYRIWWLALAMSYLGVMIGAVINGPDTPIPPRADRPVTERGLPPPARD